MMRGRPKKTIDEQAIRKDLLKAAASCLSQKSYATVSIREIADVAKTNSAMISYYFKNKQGLVTALLEGIFADEEKYQDIATYLLGVAPQKRSHVLVEAFMSLTLEQPWIFRMIVDDLVSHNQEIRRMLSTTVAGKSNQVFDQYLKAQIKDGYFRSDINQKLAKVSLLSLLVFPYLGSSILKDAYGVDIQKIRPQQMIEHVVTTFEAALLKHPSHQ